MSGANSRRSDPLELRRYNVEPYSARTFQLVLAGACDLISVKDTVTGTRARRVFNAALGYIQEGRAQATLAALKSRLAITASVRRDGAWKMVPASGLVPGDVVKLSLGGLAPADARIHDGEILVDQSMLTGESLPIEAGAGREVYAGALVRRFAR